MTIAASDVLYIGGGLAVQLFGALSWRTSPGEDNAENHTRASTGTFVDPDGNTKTAAVDVPRVNWLDEDSDGVYETPTLKIESTDELWVPFVHRPQTMTVYADFYLRQTMANLDSPFHIGASSPTTDPRCLVTSDGTYFYGVHDNGTQTATATLTAAPSLNDRVELLLRLNANGSLDIQQAVNSGSVNAASDGTAVPFATAWADQRLWIGSGGTIQHGAWDFRSIKLARGIWGMGTMRGLFE